MSEAAHKNLQQKFDELFAENQAKLSVEKRSPVLFKDYCLAVSDGYTCTLAKDHECEHVAHGRLGTIQCQWPR